MPFERLLARSALHARISREMPKTVPIASDESSYRAGVEIYRQDCAVCHGLPGEEPAAIARGMFPRPPQLFRGKGVTDDEPGETYWKVENGVRLTGMPGFEKSLSETQMWQVSLLLANADKLSDSVKQSLAAGPAAPAGQAATKH
jgi:thiosulfate dehydrogenase